MPLVTSKELLQAALEGKFAIGAFNANNMEQIQGIIDAAVEERSPVILQVSQGAIDYAGLGYASSMVKVAAQEADVPVVLHLDHGSSYSQNVVCLRAGFTSLMFDGSKLPYEENVRITKQIVELASAVGIPVEAELGKVLQSRDQVSEDEVRAAMTDPDQAREFVAETGISSLAVAVGSVHAMTSADARLDIERMKALRKTIDIPMVLHGSSGAREDSIVEAIQYGICKINVATQLNMAFVGAIKQATVDRPDNVDPRKWLSLGRDALKEVVRHKMRTFGSSGQASATGMVSPAKSFRSGELGHLE